MFQVKKKKQNPYAFVGSTRFYTHFDPVEVATQTFFRVATQPSMGCDPTKNIRKRIKFFGSRPKIFSWIATNYGSRSVFRFLSRDLPWVDGPQHYYFNDFYRLLLLVAIYNLNLNSLVFISYNCCGLQPGTRLFISGCYNF
jgi:hypothetical protein